jgi:hypothetical protein
MGANVKILNDTYNLGKIVSSVTITNAGTGYTSAPTVAFSAPTGGTAATGTVVLDGTTVDSVTIDYEGEGYVSAPTVTFSGGGGSAAAGTAVLSGTNTPNGSTNALVSFYNGGVGMTVDASTLRGMYDGTGGFNKFTISAIEWSVDSPVNVSFTGTGTTDAINVSGTGSFNYTIPNGATQPGDATNPDIVVTPVSGIDGFVFLKLTKEDFT